MTCLGWKLLERQPVIGFRDRLDSKTGARGWLGKYSREGFSLLLNTLFYCLICLKSLNRNNHSIKPGQTSKTGCETAGLKQGPQSHDLAYLHPLDAVASLARSRAVVILTHCAVPDTHPFEGLRLASVHLGSAITNRVSRLAAHPRPLVIAFVIQQHETLTPRTPSPLVITTWLRVADAAGRGVRFVLMQQPLGDTSMHGLFFGFGRA